MKSKIIRYITGVLAVLLIAGCEKDNIPYYDSTYNAVRFPGPSTFESSEPKGYDSSTGLFHAYYSFIEDPFAEYAIYDVPLILVGNRADYDRKINYIVDPERSFAPAGSYEILEAIIPADSYTGYIRIKLYNTEELDEEVCELYIALREADELSLAPEKYTNAALSWNNTIPTPTLSTQIRTYNYLVAGASSYTSTSIAYYSPNALKAIVDALGWDNWDDYDVHGASYNSNGYKYLPRATILTGNSYRSYAIKLAVYIKDYNQAHPDAPLLHNAGELKGKPVEARSYPD